MEIDETQFALHWLAGEDDGKHDLATSGIALLLEKASDFHTTFFGFTDHKAKNIAL